MTTSMSIMWFESQKTLLLCAQRFLACCLALHSAWRGDFLWSNRTQKVGNGLEVSLQVFIHWWRQDNEETAMQVRRLTNVPTDQQEHRRLILSSAQQPAFTVAVLHSQFTDCIVMHLTAVVGGGMYMLHLCAALVLYLGNSCCDAVSGEAVPLGTSLHHTVIHPPHHQGNKLQWTHTAESQRGYAGIYMWVQAIASCWSILYIQLWNTHMYHYFNFLLYYRMQTTTTIPT